MNLTQILSIELGSKCNMAHIHDKCPVNERPRGDRELSDARIVGLVEEAHLGLGFTGFVAWHFYNEPLLQRKRMFDLMDRIRYRVPESRFLLWTNGMLFKHDVHFWMFERVYVSNYCNVQKKFYEQFFPSNTFVTVMEPFFDERMNNRGKMDSSPCLRPFVEFVVSNYGDVHLCCQDWKNEVKIGNVNTDSLSDISDRRKEIIKSICLGMNDNSPEQCRVCTGRIGLPQFEPDIVKKAFEYLNNLQGIQN